MGLHVIFLRKQGSYLDMASVVGHRSCLQCCMVTYALRGGLLLAARTRMTTADEERVGSIVDSSWHHRIDYRSSTSPYAAVPASVGYAPEHLQPSVPLLG